jgi:hypothetical protein
MSEKQAVLDAVARLPETAGWAEITDALVGLVARNGSPADLARLYRSQLRADELNEYLNPAADLPLAQVVEELKSRDAHRGPA